MTQDAALTPLDCAAWSDTARIARDLIRFDTSNYGEGRGNSETEAAQYIEAELREMG